MEPGTAPPRQPPDDPSAPAAEADIPRLVAQVYEAAPVAARCGLVGTLLRPLGVLSLAAIANGIFATIRFRNADPASADVRAEDLFNVDAADVLALVQHAQQVSIEAVDALAPLLAGHAGVSGPAAALLVALLVQRAGSRGGDRTLPRDSSFDPD